MRRVLMGIALGLATAAVAQAADQQKDRLQEVTVDTVNDTAFSLPPEYGHLINVTTKSDVQYLYFEAPDGTIRIMLIGPRGAIQRARNDLQLLTPEVYVIKRGHETAEPAATPGYPNP